MGQLTTICEFDKVFPGKGVLLTSFGSHINSIDRFVNGDWLVSARHANTIYRISGSDGSVVWRLGGHSSSFELVGFLFSAQHDARILSEHSGRLLISLFDNAYNGMAQTSKVSSAVIVELDLRLMTAHLSERYFSLNGGLAQNQGSVQNLPGGNSLVSWGLTAEFSEFDKQGIRILDVAFVDSTTRAYRISKSNWVGTPPVEAMALYLYARNASSSTHFWMSWNGATEIKEWVVFGNSSPLLGRIENMGFETHTDVGKFVSEGYVEAIGKDGKVMGRSKIVDVFVPSANLGDVCGEEHCTMQVLLPDRPTEGPDMAKPTQQVMRVAPGRSMTWFNIAAGFVVGACMARIRWSTVFKRVAATYLPC